MKEARNKLLMGYEGETHFRKVSGTRRPKISCPNKR